MLLFTYKPPKKMNKLNKKNKSTEIQITLVQFVHKKIVQIYNLNRKKMKKNFVSKFIPFFSVFINKLLIIN